MTRLHRTISIAALVLGLGSVVIAQQQPLLPTPSVSGYTEVVEVPVTLGAKVGALVAINGQNFGSETGRVEIGCIEARVTSWSPTRIQVIVPSGLDTNQQQPQMLTVYCSQPPLYYRSMSFRVLP